jgi:hypothetical protein
MRLREFDAYTFLVNHLSSANVVAVMKEGTIASEGTTEELRTSGFDLVHLIRSPDFTSSTGTNQTNAENAGDELVAQEKTDVNMEDANKEAQNSYNSCTTLVVIGPLSRLTSC